MIRVYCRSDDYLYEVAFDAEPWFQHASEEEILDLARIDWGGGEAADVVGLWLEESAALQEFFEYIRELGIGFECYVDEADAMEWLRLNRPHIARDIDEGRARRQKKSRKDWDPRMQGGAEVKVRFKTASDLARFAELSGRKDWDPRPPEVSELDRESFLMAYLETALRELAKVEPLRNHSIQDITPATINELKDEIHEFMLNNWLDLEARSPLDAGKQFYFARNGNLMTFGDWDWPDPSAPNRLVKSALQYGPHKLYFDREGRIRGSEEALSGLSGRKDWDPRPKKLPVPRGIPVIPQGVQDFIDAYLEAALWSESDLDTGEPLDRDHTTQDIAPESMEKLLNEALDFLEQNRMDIGSRLSDAGHDFWLTRQGHGAGFWDGGWPEPEASRLTEAARGFGQVTLLVGDDGQIYAS